MSIKRIARADGDRFQVYEQRGGRKVYVGTYESRRAAEQAEEDFRVTQRKIDAGELAPDLDLKRTLRQAGAEWLTSLESEKSRSHSIYKRRIEQYIYPVLGDVPLARIGKANVMRWRDGLAHKVSAGTVNSTIGTLSSAFEFFRAMQWIDVNPCREVKRLEERPHDFAWLQTSEQITRLLSKCHESIRSLVALLVGTGMRLDEALHLRWDDIDLEHRLIHVHRGRQGTTKSGKARRVPIFDSVIPLLKAMKLARGENVLLFPNPKGKVRSKPGVFRPFKAAVAAAGLPLKLRLHDLRHSFAVLYLLDGGDLHRLSRILGHSTVITTERAYLAFKPTAFDLDYGRVRFAMPSGAPAARLAAI